MSADKAAEAHERQFGGRTFEVFEPELIRTYGGDENDLYTEKF